MILIPFALLIVFVFSYRYHNKRELKFLHDFMFTDLSFDKPTNGNIKELIEWSHSSQKKRHQFTDMFQRYFSIFTANETMFKHYLNSKLFFGIFNDYNTWIKSLNNIKRDIFNRFLKGALFLFGITGILYTLFFSYIYDLDLGAKIEIIFSTIHIATITVVYYTEIVPFIIAKKINQSNALFTRRSTEDFYKKNIYNALFIAGFLGYFTSILFLDVTLHFDVLVSFFHVLLIGQFTDQLVEKGSPLNPEIKPNRVLNLNILLSRQTKIVIAVFAVLYFQIYFLNFLSPDPTISMQMRAFWVIYILLILCVHLVKTRKQKKNLVDQFNAEFKIYSKTNGAT